MKQNKYVHVPLRVISWGEKMNNVRLAQSQRIKDDHIARQNRRRLKKLSRSKPDNL
jgi:hypothetical protein